MGRRISPARKGLYYTGLALIAIGLLAFGSVFVTGALHFGDFHNFEANAKSEMLRAFGGMALVFLGGVLAVIGARGAAGSGVVLDPQRAREDLEPYSRMAGGMLHDAIDESGLLNRAPTEPRRVVMIKCPSCGKLNEEDARFCQECGKPL